MQTTTIPPKPLLPLEETKIAFSHISDQELKRKDHLFTLFNREAIVKVGTRFTEWALRWHLPVQKLIEYTIFEQFVGGKSLPDAEKVLQKLGKYGVFTILDYGVEAKQSEKEFDQTLSVKLKTLELTRTHPFVKMISVKVSGLGSFQVLEKVHSGQKLNASENQSFHRLKERLTQLCEKAAECETSIFFDAEETWIQGALDELMESLMKLYNQKNPIVYTTVQLYCTDRLYYLQRLIEEAEKHGFIAGAKLVRGAYMEKERARALKMGYPSPIHPNKEAVDKDFQAALDLCLQKLNHVAFCCASHNEFSNAYLAEQMVLRGISRNHPHISFAQLYGMGDHLTFHIANAGFQAFKLVPYGPVKEVIPYLMRRASENSSVGGQMSRELSLIRMEIKRRALSQ